MIKVLQISSLCIVEGQPVQFFIAEGQGLYYISYIFVGDEDESAFIKEYMEKIEEQDFTTPYPGDKKMCVHGIIFHSVRIFITGVIFTYYISESYHSLSMAQKDYIKLLLMV